MTAADRYRNFGELCQHETEGKDFVILVKPGSGAPLVMAPHGGGIEPGTADIAHAIAGNDYGFYAFQGIKPSGNAVLHITSNNFDEPRALRLARRADWVLTIHGCQDREPIIFAGGRAGVRRGAIIQALLDAGFDTRETEKEGLRGNAPGNICNRGRNGRGVQLEISDGLRREMFDRLRKRTGRRKTQVFHRFVAAVRMALAALAPRSVAVPAEADRQRPVWRIARNCADRRKVFAVRAIVFIEEQAVSFDEEFDEWEDEAIHILGEIDGEPVAAGRLRFADGWAKLERVAVRKAYRGHGFSRGLIDCMIELAEKQGYPRCRLHAQVHLIDLYRKHGFLPQGETFSEAGIDHRLMVREPPPATPPCRPGRPVGAKPSAEAPGPESDH